MGCGRPQLSNGEAAWSVGTVRCHQTIHVLDPSKTKMRVLVVEVISTPAYAGCQLPGDELRSLDVADGQMGRWVGFRN